MCLDHTAQIVYLAARRGEHFSNGTDFKTMLHYQANGQEEELAEYLGDIFQLQANFAKSNKPIMTVAPGHSFNSAAGPLAASGFPSICHSSELAFNECTFGFVPHAGTTYFTSRLPGDFGTFLALTGVPLSGKDGIRLGLADALVELPGSYDKDIAEIVTAMDPPSLPGSRDVRGLGATTRLTEVNPVDDAVNARSELEKRNLRDDLSELQRRTGSYHHGEPFMEPGDRRPDLVAEADLGYEALLRRHDQSRSKPEGPGYFDHAARTHNFFDYTHRWLSAHAGHSYAEDAVKSLLQHSEMIDRCFWPDSVEEIMENLKRETHPFAKEIL